MCVTCQLVSCSDSFLHHLVSDNFTLPAVTNCLQQSTTLSNTPFMHPAGVCVCVCVHMPKVYHCVETCHFKRSQDSFVKRFVLRPVTSKELKICL